MSPEAKQAAMSELDGWTQAFPADKGRLLLPYKWHNSRTGENNMELPDYLNDLNAVHEVHELLTPVQHTRYRREIQAIVYRGPLLPGNKHRSTTHATPGQRVEALLRTLGKWHDDTKVL